jgi:hypothetical protein
MTSGTFHRRYPESPLVAGSAVEESFSSAISGAVRESSTRVWHRCGGWESITLRAQFTSRSRSTLQETVARRGAVASGYRFVSRWGHLPPSPKCLDQGVS